MSADIIARYRTRRGGSGVRFGIRTADEAEQLLRRRDLPYVRMETKDGKYVVGERMKLGRRVIWWYDPDFFGGQPA